VKLNIDVNLVLSR